MKAVYEIRREDIELKDEQGTILAEITYPENEPGVFVIDHTWVDDSLRGQGIASKLVELAVARIIKNGGKVQATCPYAVKWLEKNRK